MSEATSQEVGFAYEAPTLKYYGDVTSLTEAAAGQPNTDALCAGTATIAGVPSHVVCKTIP